MQATKTGERLGLSRAGQRSMCGGVTVGVVLQDIFRFLSNAVDGDEAARAWNTTVKIKRQLLVFINSRVGHLSSDNHPVDHGRRNGLRGNEVGGGAETMCWVRFADAGPVFGRGPPPAPACASTVGHDAPVRVEFPKEGPVCWWCHSTAGRVQGLQGSISK